MRPHQSIATWLPLLLPDATQEARAAAHHLLVALLAGASAKLCELARYVERNPKARSNRQYLFRWLSRPAWEPPQIYPKFLALLSVLTRGWKEIPLVLDYTYLSDFYVVLQVSLAFQKRALPLLRLVRAGRGGEGGQQEMLEEALAWLKQHLPGPRERYVLLGDRGFPSHSLIKTVQKAGWRYVFRIKTDWKMTHPEYSGILEKTVGLRLKRGMRGCWYGNALFGNRDAGQKEWCRSHIVWCWEAKHKEPWILLTSEAEVRAAKRLYRKRAGIECEFRDVKQGRKAEQGTSKRARVGTGVSWLMKWGSVERVARFLLWVAVREWRLACLWWCQHLSTWGRDLEVGGKLSWFSIAREWVRRNPLAALYAQTTKPAFYESP